MTNELESVCRMSELLALQCGYSLNEAKQIRTAAALHDIGKVRISPEILSKPGKLTLDEFSEMKMHTKYGVKILVTLYGTLGKMAREIALLHHERFDKKGYWGYDITVLPPYTSIVAICDVAVALLSRRCYKPP